MSTTHERRQHFRIDDEVYFDYRILNSGEMAFDKSITQQLLGIHGKRFMDTVQYFETIDKELEGLTQQLVGKEPSIAHYLNLLNAKIDFVSRQLFMGGKIHLRKVNISLGGMTFKTTEKVAVESALKMVIYVKPKMVPIIVDAKVVYCEHESGNYYRTAVQFYELNVEHEQLLSQHIMLAQFKNHGN